MKQEETLRKELEAGILPEGTYGDMYDGRTFSDEQSRILEERSRELRPGNDGWYKEWKGGQCWTLIRCTKLSNEYKSHIAEMERDLAEAAARGERLAAQSLEDQN